MQSVKKTLINNTIIENANAPGSVTAEVGLVLMDLSLRVVGYDRAAATILNGQSQNGGKAGTLTLPKEILDVLRSHKPSDMPPAKVYLRRGKYDYVCRAHVVESFDGSFKPMIALHLEKDFSASDAAHELGTKYNLTEREQEALRGILMGLTSKEVAERMNISPNTVKAFSRLIMIKMGVTRRAGIVAKILENRTNTEDFDAIPSAPPQRPMLEAAASSVRAAAHNSRKQLERIHPRPRAF